MKPSKFTAELIENRLIVWDTTQGSELYKMRYFGKPLGIPKPKIFDFKVPLLLDLLEGLYLKKKGRIDVFEDNRKVTTRELKKRARHIYRDFEVKYAVYEDLRERDLIVQPGIKFGCDFAVYERGPGIDHAPFLIQVKKKAEFLDAIEVVKAGRLATTVRKRFIIAVPDSRRKEVDYLMFQWWKA
ncbi:MAG: tRNA-intron lyase [Candidatus Bathyarchaeia archaeon]